MPVTLVSFEDAPVRTRKPHLCAYCGDIIPIGAKGTRRESGIDDSEGPQGEIGKTKAEAIKNWNRRVEKE